jgi:alpha-L-rhamnosidase
MKWKMSLEIVLIVMLSHVGASAAEPFRVAGLRCESRIDPMGIDVPQPRFHWIMESTARGQAQSAYQVLVSTSQEALQRDEGVAWDSGRVASSDSVAVTYAGKPLVSCRPYWWKVRTWDQNGKVSPWSAVAGFGTGKLAPGDWKGDWIGTGLEPDHGAVYMRREIDVKQPVKRAVVFFSGLGFSELAIDGKRVGDYVIGPGFTTYDKRVQYLIFDVTSHFKSPGVKTLDATLVDGWYALSKDPWVHHFEKNQYVDRPKLLLNLHFQYADGSESLIVSDTNWRWSTGEITSSWIASENVDLRKSERNWQPVAVVPGPKGQLVSQRELPNRVMEEVQPVKATYDPTRKSCLFDFGRQINGWVRLKIAGPRGKEIKITCKTLVPGDDGKPRVFTQRGSRFVLAGTGANGIYEPRFFHAGMQQVEVQGLSEEPAKGDLVGCAISSMVTPSGHFRCSDELQTWLNDAVRRTVVMYTTFLPNDPVREWKAWTQDIQNMFVSAVYLFDSQAMYERWQYDMLDGQLPDGNVPEVAPGNVCDSYNSPWWGGCAVWLPWYWYQYYGDRSLLKASYPAMKRYVDFLEKAANKDGLQDWGLTDWLPVESTPRPMVNTPGHYLCADIVSRTATLLGFPEDAKVYAAKAVAIRDNFNARFLDKASGIYGLPRGQVGFGNWKYSVPLAQMHETWWTGDRPCTQAGQVLPLALGIVPPENRAAAEQSLLREIVAHRGKLSTGFVATPYLLQVLADLDPEAAWKMTSAQEFPSWHSMTRGANSDLLKETWAGGQALMPSLGGNIAGWHTEALGGIRPAAPGFKKILIKPAVVGDLTWVECDFDSPYGRIISKWKREGQNLQMDVTVPPNTTATVYVPSKDAAEVTESGKPAVQAEGVKFMKMDRGAVVYEVGSGTYCFRSQM